MPEKTILHILLSPPSGDGGGDGACLAAVVVSASQANDVMVVVVLASQANDVAVVVVSASQVNDMAAVVVVDEVWEARNSDDGGGGACLAAVAVDEVWQARSGGGGGEDTDSWSCLVTTLLEHRQLDEYRIYVGEFIEITYEN